MGCSTRLDVRLRGDIPTGSRGASFEEFTDLDVLGIGFTPAGQLHTTFADCRSSQKSALERMFWVRGVADFVGANDAYLIRAHKVPEGARTLSPRLGVGVLTPEDLAAMENVFPTALNLQTGPLSCLFDRAKTGVHLNASKGADRKLSRLFDYLDFDFWVFDPYRNLTQLVAHLSDAVATLDPGNRTHRTLFYDCAWHYALSVARAVAFVRSTRMADVPTAVRTYAGGGELALREKAGLADLLQRNGWPAARDIILPPYIDQLTELVGRFLVHPSELAEVLRYAEYLAVSEINHIDDSVAAAFTAQTRPVAAKLLADICGFLVTAAGMRPDFRAAARRRLILDLTGGSQNPPASSPTGGTVDPLSGNKEVDGRSGQLPLES
jgi:hypothetical protein